MANIITPSGPREYLILIVGVPNPTLHNLNSSIASSYSSITFIITQFHDNVWWSPSNHLVPKSDYSHGLTNHVNDYFIHEKEPTTYCRCVLRNINGSAEHPLVEKGLGVAHQKGIHRGASPFATHNGPLLFFSRGAGDLWDTTICLSRGAHISAPRLPVCHAYLNLVSHNYVFWNLFFCQPRQPPRRSRGALGQPRSPAMVGCGEHRQKEVARQWQPRAVDGAGGNDLAPGSPDITALLLGHQRRPCVFCGDTVAPWRWRRRCSLGTGDDLAPLAPVARLFHLGAGIKKGHGTPWAVLIFKGGTGKKKLGVPSSHMGHAPCGRWSRQWCI
jgi:hypothetical protein